MMLSERWSFFMENLWSYIVAVFSHWATLATGGGVMALLAIWEHHTGTTVPKKVYWVIMIVFMVAAMFLAWRDERIASVNARQSLARNEQELAEERRRNRPDLSGIIDEVGMGQPADGSLKTAIFLTVSVRNKGGAPSVAEAWTVEITIPGIGPKAAPIVYSDQPFELHREGRSTVVRAPSETIYEKTATPIPSGGMTRGTLVCFLDGITKDQAWQAGTTIRVKFEDINGESITFEKVMTARKDLEPMHFPGLRASP
jgi:hypothetical protein